MAVKIPMLLSLVPHPDTPCDAVRAVTVDIVRSGARISLTYAVQGEIGRIVLPPRGPLAQTDELWKHTCFEAFFRVDDAYGEVNLSPSNRWAAYAFDGYRSGMRPWDEVQLRQFADRRSDAAVYDLAADLTVTGFGADQAWSVGLSAVIELTDGRRCYWALRHPAGKPDFHHPDAFAFSLPPESR